MGSYDYVSQLITCFNRHYLVNYFLQTNQLESVDLEWQEIKWKRNKRPCGDDTVYTAYHILLMITQIIWYMKGWRRVCMSPTSQLVNVMIPLWFYTLFSKFLCQTWWKVNRIEDQTWALQILSFAPPWFCFNINPEM